MKSMRRGVIIGTAVVVASVVSGCAPLVRAPNLRAGEPVDLHHGTTLALAGGMASGSSDVGGLGSGSIGWEFNRRVGIEGSASWLDRGVGANAFAASLTVQTNLTRPHAWVPFVEGGPAMYRASFESSQSVMPGFYRDRVGNADTATAMAFRDPAFVLGGGVNFFTRGHLAIRPAFDVVMATRNSQSYRLNMFTVRAVYHFERHPTAP